MFTYRFTGEDERVFGHLTHGAGVQVQRDGSGLTGERLDDGSYPALDHTVVLLPGDVLLADELQVHAELEPADAATVTAHARAAADEQLPTRKADLVALAEARGLDTSGTAADLTARLTNQGN